MALVALLLLVAVICFSIPGGLPRCDGDRIVIGGSMLVAGCDHR